MSGIHLQDGRDGTVLLIVGTTATVMLESSTGAELRDDVQRAIEGPEPAVAFLSTLTASGVRDLPPFAYVGREGTTARILLRGPIEAIERRADGTEAVHEAGSVSTWTEVLRDGCSDVSLRLASGAVCAVVAFTPPPDPQSEPSASSDEERMVSTSVRDDAGDVASRSAQGGASSAGSASPVHAVAAPSVGTSGAPPVLVPNLLITEPPGSSVVGGSRADETMLPTDLADERAEVDGDDELTTVVPVIDKPHDIDADVDLSHLFETRHVGVEAAAVRSDEPPPPPAPHAGMPEHDAGEASSSLGFSASRPSLPPPSGPAVSLPPPPAVLGGTPSEAARAAPLPPPVGPPVAAPPPPGLIAGVPGAPSDPAGDEAATSPTPSSGASDPSFGDHDGLTISPAQLAALRSGTAPTAAASAARSAGPQLQAVACPTGHLNPPQADQCRCCGAAIADRTIRVVARPTLGHLRFDGGMVADIDRPMLIGRKPTVDGLVPGAEVPALVVLPDPDGSLSRVHAEIRLEGWEVLVVDRDSTNGTRVEVPGQPPVLLRPHEPFLVSPGTTITLADAVTCTYQPGPR